MSESGRGQTWLDYLHAAQNFIAERDYEGFVCAIAGAKILAAEDANINDVQYWYIKGLYKFGKYAVILKEVDNYLVIEHDDKKIAEVLQIKGVSKGKLGKNQEAHDIFEQLAKHEDVLARLGALNNLTWLYLQEYEKSGKDIYLDRIISICQAAAEEFDRIDESNLKKMLVVRLGIAYLYKGQFELTLSCYLKALEFVPGDPNALNNLASLYIRTGDTVQAGNYLEKAEKESEQRKNYIELAYIYQNYAELMELISDYSQAREYYLIALDYFVEERLSKQVYICLKHILRLDGVINIESISVISRKLCDRLVEGFGEDTHTNMEGLVTI